MPNKSRISPSPTHISDLTSFEWTKWFNSLTAMLGTSPLKVQAYSVADLATDDLDAARWGELTPKDAFSSIVFVYDESAGPTLAYSNGTDWLRVQDNAIVT